MPENEKWVACEAPAIDDILRWNEPLWAAPNKPRGKRDKIGEQQITAQLLGMVNFLEFRVLEVKKLSVDNVPLGVKAGDLIRRQNTTLAQGQCQKQTGERPAP